MFRAIAHDFDPAYWTRGSVAVLLASAGGTALGTGWLVYVVIERIAWFLILALLRWWFPPALALALLPPEPVTTVLVERTAREVVAERFVKLDLDAPIEERDLSEPDPVAVAPPVHRAAEPTEVVRARLTEEIRTSGLLLKMIGTTGSSNTAVADLWGDSSGLGSIDDALASGSALGGLVAGPGESGGFGTLRGGGGGAADIGTLGGGTAVVGVAKPIDDVLDKGAIRDAVMARMHKFQGCFTRALQKDPELGGGKVVVRFGITPGGRANDVQIVSTSFGRPAVEGCLVDALRDVQFPPSGHGASSVTWPFVFSVQ
ncbi:MAG: energy transducer TonB [Alphaproteobacteria bacterium]|nr:energy transducer TonB [Alphaproteobacteria bacterium]